MTVFLGQPLSGKTTRMVEAFNTHVERGVPPDAIVCLSFFSANANAIQGFLRAADGHFLPWVTTVQRFQTLLLRRYAAQARLAPRVRDISPTVRGLLIRQAWAQVGGPLWRAYGAGESGQVPGAVTELVRVFDWLAQNRTAFRLEPGELGDHELAQAYAAYIAHCEAHGLLTFQEASLRCLDLLADPAVAADVTRRFPVLLVDDLHLARPDQLALLKRLRDLAASATATAWLPDSPQSPELRLIQQALPAWGEAEWLTPTRPVNPAISAVSRRLFAPAADPVDAPHPLELHSAFTVEDEAQAVAQAITSALLADETLTPDVIAVVALNADLLPLAQRVLAEYGLPVAPPLPPARRTPLVQAGLLTLRWVRLGPTPEVERELLGLPFVALDPLDQHTLLARAALLARCPLALTPDDLAPLELSAATRQRLDALRTTLSALDPRQPAAALLDAAVTALGGSAWVLDDTTFAPALRQAWLKAFTDWLQLVRDLEALPGLASTPAEHVDLAEQLTDQVALAGTGGGVQLVSGDATNGVRARRAYVIGLSENAAPRLASDMQLLPEAALPALFADGRAVVLPEARQPAAWLEREGRRVAAALTRGTDHLWVSTSRYTLSGDAQLPSPFFERLLGPNGELDRDGRLTLRPGGLWRWADLPPGAPVRLLPQLGLEPAQPQPLSAPEQLLDGQTFSATQLRAYLSCPLQFFYARVLRLETEGSSALDQGGLLHEILCAVVGDGRLARVNLLDRPRPTWLHDAAALQARAQAALDAAWIGLPAELPGGGAYTPSQAWGPRFGPALQRQAVRRWAARVLDDWAAFEVDGLPDRAVRRPVLLEASFALELGGFRLRGRLDRVDEVRTAAGVIYEIIDYKTGQSHTGSLAAHLKQFLPEGDDPPADYQLPLYALGLQQGLAGLQQLPRRLSLLNVEALTKGKRGQYGAQACRTIELIDAGELDRRAGRVPIATLNGEISAGIQATLARMSASPYPAQPGFHCGWCSFRAACERRPGAAEAA